MQPDIIAFAGKKGAGKDTAANILIKAHGFHKVAFADPLREVAKIVFGLTDDEMTDRVLKETVLDQYPFMSPRQVLQRIGTECFRTNFPGVWIEAFKRTARHHTRVVVTDLRFPDERDAIAELGGYIVKVVRPELEAVVDPHPSEAYIDEMQADLTIINNGTLMQFEAKVATELGKFFIKRRRTAA